MNDDPRSVDERRPLGCSAIAFIPLSAFILNETMKVQKLNDPLTSLLLSLLQSVAVASLMFFCAGLLWAVTGLEVIKQTLDFIAIKFAWTIVPFLILILVLVVIAVIKG